MNYSFCVKPNEHERIETTIHLQADHRPALIGTVLNETGKPVEDALITIYKSGCASKDDTTIGTVYTDNLGRFAFGPLEPNHLYEVKVFKYDENSRILEQNFNNSKFLL